MELPKGQVPPDFRRRVFRPALLHAGRPGLHWTPGGSHDQPELRVPRFYVSGIVGGDRDHRRVDCAVVARGPSRARGGTPYPMSEQPEESNACGPKLRVKPSLFRAGWTTTVGKPASWGQAATGTP